MKRRFFNATLVISTLGLAACASTPHSTHAALKISGNSVPLAEDATSYLEQRIADGKRQLKEQNYGAALTSFREARLDQRHAGEAYNGMAIAYASLGRNDLAELYFTRAAGVENADPKFAANLQRFHAQLAANSAKIPQSPTRSLEIKRASLDNTRKTPLVSLHIEAPSNRLVRLANNEVALRTGSAADRGVSVVSRPRPEVLARGQANSPGYPLRIALSSPGSKVVAIGSRAIDRGYPIRIALSDK